LKIGGAIDVVMPNC